MNRLKWVLSVVFAVSITSLGTGCFVIAGAHREERHGGYRQPVVRSRVIIIVDDVWIHRHGSADLYIDGRFHGRVSGRAEIEVDEGEHNFEFRHKGLPPHVERLSVRRGQPFEIRPRFRDERDDQREGRGKDEKGERRVESRAPVVKSRVIVVVDDGWAQRHGPSELYIDGKLHGRVSGRAEIDIDEGEHNFEFRHAGLLPHAERISVRGGQPLEIRPRFKEEKDDRGEGRGNDDKGGGKGKDDKSQGRGKEERKDR